MCSKRIKTLSGFKLKCEDVILLKPYSCSSIWIDKHFFIAARALCWKKCFRRHRGMRLESPRKGVSETWPNEELIEVVNYRKGPLPFFIFFTKISLKWLGYKIRSKVWKENKKSRVCCQGKFSGLKFPPHIAFLLIIYRGSCNLYSLIQNKFLVTAR